MKMLSSIMESTTRVNSHRLSHDNPHGTVETNFQRCFLISVWCGMMNDMFIGPVILYDHIIGRNYLDLLQNRLLEQLVDVPLAIWIAMYFQHDGVPSHYS
jgi:hypothetical protein